MINWMNSPICMKLKTLGSIRLILKKIENWLKTTKFLPFLPLYFSKGKSFDKVVGPEPNEIKKVLDKNLMGWSGRPLQSSRT